MSPEFSLELFNTLFLPPSPQTAYLHKLWTFRKEICMLSLLLTPPETELCNQHLPVSCLFNRSITDWQIISRIGLTPSSPPVELEMVQPDGTFSAIRTIQPDFGSADVVFFYATADGTITDAFDAPKTFPGNKFLTLNLFLDDYPEEVSIVLDSGNQEIWFRPYRYYTKNARQQITEQIPIPNELRAYRLTIRDSSFDGIVSGIEKTNYTVSYNDVILVEDVFETSGQSITEFSLDPSAYDTESPTMSPTDPPAGPSTPAPTETPEDVDRSTPTSSSPSKAKTCLAAFFGLLSGVVAVLL